MAKKAVTSKTYAAKKPAKTPIVYELQPKWATLIKRRLALAKAQAQATATLNMPSKSLAKAPASALRRKLIEQAQEIAALERQTCGGSARPALQMGGPFQLAPRFFETYELMPTAVNIGLWAPDENGVLLPSSLIYPCPNDGTGHYWAADFTNGQVTLTRTAVLGILGSNFTGKVLASASALAQGIADIQPGGSILLNTGCYIAVCRPVQGPPGMITVASAGVIYAWPYGGSNEACTHGSGIVNLNASQVQVDFQCTDARPGDQVQITQTLCIVATNATVCALVEGLGTLETPPPTVQIEYSNLPKVGTLPALPHWPKLPRRGR